MEQTKPLVEKVMRYATRHSRKSVKAQSAKQDFQLVVEDNRGTGEEVRMYEMDILHPHNAVRLKRGEIRLFDPARDDRGPEVQMIATYTGKASSWFPKTSGIYMVQFIPGVELPEDVKRWSLGFGTCTAPQYKASQIHRVWLDLTTKPLTAHLTPYLQIVKRPCVFCKDALGFLGGSTVVIDPAMLPPACKESEIGKTFMG